VITNGTPTLPVADHREHYGGEAETSERVEDDEPYSAAVPGNEQGGPNKADRGTQCDASLGGCKKASAQLTR
jgi:hypothetical protein